MKTASVQVSGGIDVLDGEKFDSPCNFLIPILMQMTFTSVTLRDAEGKEICYLYQGATLLI